MVRFGPWRPQIGDYRQRPVLLGDVVLGEEWDNGMPERRRIIWARKFRMRWPSKQWVRA